VRRRQTSNCAFRTRITIECRVQIPPLYGEVGGLRPPPGGVRAAAHRRYAAFFNARARVTGHLFQGRFASVVMDEEHLIAALRYLAFNPVRAALVAAPKDWQASVRAHLAGRDDGLVIVAPVLARVGRFADLLEPTLEERMRMEGFETKSANGRPMGTPAFIEAVERALGRKIAPAKRGPKPNERRE
jgi:putative transposase